MKRILIQIIIAMVVPFSAAFAPVSQNNIETITTAATTTTLSAIRFEKETQTWFADDPEEIAGSSYGPIGSLYRAGPKPFLQRIFQADTYDQAVLKYMAKEGCDRKEAQGNMDAFLDNCADWTYQKMQEQQGKPVKDYANANMSPKQITLSTIWAVGVVYFIYNLLTNYSLNDSFQRTMEILNGNIGDGHLLVQELI